MQEAVVAALQAWRVDGIPPNPGGWLTLAARRRAIDRLRRSVREEKAIDALTFADSRARLLAEEDADPAAAAPGESRPTGDAADERIPMLFGCCHPALRVEARLASCCGPSSDSRRPRSPGRSWSRRRPWRSGWSGRRRRSGRSASRFEIPAGPGASESARRGADRDLPDLQRRLPLPGGRRPGRRRDLVGRAAGPVASRGGGGLGAARPADESVGASAVPASTVRAGWSCWPTRTAPPGTRCDLARAEGYLVRSAELRRPGRFQLQAAIAACHADAAALGGHRLAADPDPLRPAAHAMTRRPWSGSTTPSP